MLEGHDEIGRFLADRDADKARRTAHLIVHDTFPHIDADEAVLRARVVLLLHQDTGGYRVEQVVETEQTFDRQTDGSWRIALRDETPLHKTPRL